MSVGDGKRVEVAAGRGKDGIKSQRENRQIGHQRKETETCADVPFVALTCLRKAPHPNVCQRYGDLNDQVCISEMELML